MGGNQAIQRWSGIYKWSEWTKSSKWTVAAVIAGGVATVATGGTFL